MADSDNVWEAAGKIIITFVVLAVFVVGVLTLLEVGFPRNIGHFVCISQEVLPDGRIRQIHEWRKSEGPVSSLAKEAVKPSTEASP